MDGAITRCEEGIILSMHSHCVHVLVRISYFHVMDSTCKMSRRLNIRKRKQPFQECQLGFPGLSFKGNGAEWLKLCLWLWEGNYLKTFTTCLSLLLMPTMMRGCEARGYLYRSCLQAYLIQPHRECLRIISSHLSCLFAKLWTAFLNSLCPSPLKIHPIKVQNSQFTGML